MCGIVGLISRRSNGFFSQDAEMMENLLVMDTMRGMDSTGAFCITGSKQILAIKHASHPLHTFRTEEWSKFRSKMINAGRIVIGHNRKATQGSVSSENAHPFIEGNIVLVHNGTLRGHKELADKDVDSHAVCHAFSEKGAENVIPTIDGAFAFVWWDTKKERLFAVRNEERPLAIVVTEDAYAIASEPWMPTVLFSRNSKKVTDTIILEPGELYSFELNGKYTTSKVKLREKAPIIPIRPASDMGENDDEWGTGGWGGHMPPFRQQQGTSPRVNQQAAVEERRAATSPLLLNRGMPHDDPNFKAAEVIRIKLNRFYCGEHDSRVKAFGKVDQQGKPVYDVVCFLPPKVDIGHCEEWQNSEVLATVTNVTCSNCGPSVWVRDPHIIVDPEAEETVKTNKDTITLSEWNKLVETHHCDHCNEKLNPLAAEFTTVQKYMGGRFRVTCPNCVEDKLPEGEIKNEFVKRRDLAVQDGVSKREKLIILPNGKVGTEGTPTVH